MHFITGGSTADQAAEGDYLDKDTRYERTREYIQIVKRAWTSTDPFDYDGKHYQLENFRADIFPVQQPRPRISFGGSSAAAYAVGAAESDIYALWGEPLAGTREQIASPSRRRRRRPGERSARDCRSPSVRSSPRPRNWPGRRRKRSLAGSRP